MIKGKGTFRKVAGRLLAEELRVACDKLPDNAEYSFLIVDNEKNRKLPVLSYLFSVVLTYLSDNLPDKPSTIALYKFFEDMYAPLHTCTINGERFDYCELKSEKSIDVNNFIEMVVEYAADNWGIIVPRSEVMKDPENRELYSQAYLNQDIAWQSVISSLKSKNTNERRNLEGRF